MERNEVLIREIADHIEAFPETYNQGDWCSKYGTDEDGDYTEGDYVVDECGTTACIAGHAVCIAQFNGDFKKYADWYYNSEYSSSRVQESAGPLMGLDRDNATALFQGGWEPHKGLSVPDALRKIAEGAEVLDVTYDPDEEY